MAGGRAAGARLAERPEGACRDAKGHQQHLFVRNTGPGANSIQQIHDLGDGYRDQVLIDAAEDQLVAEMAATPLDQRKKLSQKVHAPGGTYDVTLDTNGKLSVKKEAGFWRSVLHALEAIAPIALAIIPGVGPIASAAYLGATRGYDVANGNVVGGLAAIAGGMAGVGGVIGGATGSAIEDAATVARYGDRAYAAVHSGNLWGVIDAAAGAVPGVADLAGDLGASDGFAASAEAVAGEIASAARVGEAGQAALNAVDTGNIFGGVSGFAALVPQTLGMFGTDGEDPASSLQPALTAITSAARFGRAVQSTVTAAERGNVVAAIIADAASAVLQVP